MLAIFSCSQRGDKEKEDQSGIVEVIFAGDNNDDLLEEAVNDMPDPETLSVLLTEKLDTAGLDPYFPNNRERRALEDKLKGFYEEMDHELVWITSKGISEQGHDLLEAIENTPNEGLNVEHYSPDRFKDLISEVKAGSKDENSEKLVDLDLLFTSTYLVLASDMSSGRLNPYKFENGWIPSVPEKDLKDQLIEAFESNNIKESLSDLAPDHPQYIKLKEVLAHYKSLSNEHKLNKIEIDSVIQKGDSGEIISEIRNLLGILGDFEEDVDTTELLFDEKMEEAVKSFQTRYGLLTDGILGPDTYEKMNIPIKDKIKQIKLNLERLRWLPRNMAGEYIMVNVPEFRLRIFDGDDINKEMKVIVGKEFNSTPIFSDTLEYISFSPTWTVPLSILKEEFYEKLVKDSTYLERNHYELYPDWNKDSEPMDAKSIDWKSLDKEDLNYRVVQKPGPWNALGQMKFMMPNKMAIYLHDTPTEHLFEEKERDYSHGCIRVERPVELANYLLQDDSFWSKSKIREYVNLDEPENVILPKKIPVHIVYKTTWVDENNKVHFLSDIYNHDEMQMAALEKSIDLN